MGTVCKVKASATGLGKQTRLGERREPRVFARERLGGESACTFRIPVLKLALAVKKEERRALFPFLFRPVAALWSSFSSQTARIPLCLTFQECT